MTITTKYDLGQQVWALNVMLCKCGCCNLTKETFFVDPKFSGRISALWVDGSPTEQNIFYKIEDVKTPQHEPYLFPTEEEARAEADRRNSP